MVSSFQLSPPLRFFPYRQAGSKMRWAHLQARTSYYSFRSRSLRVTFGPGCSRTWQGDFRQMTWGQARNSLSSIHLTGWAHHTGIGFLADVGGRQMPYKGVRAPGDIVVSLTPYVKCLRQWLDDFHTDENAWCFTLPRHFMTLRRPGHTSRTCARREPVVVEFASSSFSFTLCVTLRKSTRILIIFQRIN